MNYSILTTFHCFSPLQSVFEAPVNADSIPADIDGDEADDGVCIASKGDIQVLQYEYHILFSSSYSTPVLYFRASTVGKLHLTLWLHTHTFCPLHVCVLYIYQYSFFHVDGEGFSFIIHFIYSLCVANPCSDIRNDWQPYWQFFNDLILFPLASW